MSKPSKSENQTKTSSSTASMCPPTARSVSLLTADALTEPNQIPTALSNSVNTAIGASPSGSDASSGMSDTSAGSNSSGSEPRTAKSAKSHEKIMNDLRRGSLFGRQSHSQATEGPKSVTNITFSSNNTNVSTASEPKSAKVEKKLGNSQKAGDLSTKSLKTGKDISKSRFSSKKFQSIDPLSSTSSASRKTRKRSPNQKMKTLKTQEKDFSVKSTKSAKTAKSAKTLDFSAKSGKSAKSAKMAYKSVEKPNEQKSKKAPKGKCGRPANGMSGVVKKGDRSQKSNNDSAYFPAFSNPPNQPPRRNGMSANRTPVYHFPGTGRCTRNMNTVAPVDSSVAPIDNSHCVYDVANLGASQRRVPPPPPPPNRKPTSLFGAGPKVTASAPPSEASSAMSEKQPACNKIVVIAATPDGKTKVQMTIDLQVVAGEALGQSGKPVDLVPKKILVHGEEIPVEKPKQGQ